MAFPLFVIPTPSFVDTCQGYPSDGSRIGVGSAGVYSGDPDSNAGGAFDNWYGGNL